MPVAIYAASIFDTYSTFSVDILPVYRMATPSAK